FALPTFCPSTIVRRRLGATRPGRACGGGVGGVGQGPGPDRAAPRRGAVCPPRLLAPHGRRGGLPAGGVPRLRPRREVPECPCVRGDVTHLVRLADHAGRVDQVAESLRELHLLGARIARLVRDADLLVPIREQPEREVVLLLERFVRGRVVEGDPEDLAAQLL